MLNDIMLLKECYMTIYDCLPLPMVNIVRISSREQQWPYAACSLSQLVQTKGCNIYNAVLKLAVNLRALLIQPVVLLVRT